MCDTNYCKINAPPSVLLEFSWPKGAISVRAEIKQEMYPYSGAVRSPWALTLAPSGLEKFLDSDSGLRPHTNALRETISVGCIAAARISSAAAKKHTLMQV